MSTTPQIYGYDWGTPDCDLPHNHDNQALSNHDKPKKDVRDTRVDSPLSPPTRDEWYYSSPVPVIFPEDLNPLPKRVLENPMNIVYFHYFVNYTSKILVTHDCASNPFRTVLPRLALQDENLLSLVLAYAACHRARLLNHPEPVNRIASCVDQLFPRFRQALASGQPVSETLFGTCVMLASLTQSYPMAFDAPIKWPQHLSIARQMCHSITSNKERRPSKAMFFFLRWFGYLDTFGSCSANVYNGSYQTWSGDPIASEHDPSLKCLIGYTNRALILLARSAELAKQCSQERNQTGKISSTLILASQHLRCSLELTSLEIPHQRYDCTCVCSSASSDTFRAVNMSLCYSALIILQRKVYLLPSNSPLVQSAVQGILAALSGTESGRDLDLDIPDIILPLFLVGCESRDPSHRQEIMRRLQRIGDAGMSQVARVRGLIQHVWEAGQDWTLVDHEVLLG